MGAKGVCLPERVKVNQIHAGFAVKKVRIYFRELHKGLAPRVSGEYRLFREKNSSHGN